MGNKARVKAKTKSSGTGQEKQEKKKPRWPEAKQPYAEFPLELTPGKLVTSRKDLLNNIEALTAEKVATEMKALPKRDRKPTKVNGKQYTAVDGAFLVRLVPPDDDPNKKLVRLLFSLDDLYLQAFHVEDVWFILEDAKIALPPKSQVQYKQTEVKNRKGQKYVFKDGIYIFPWNGSYVFLGGGRYQPFKYGDYQKARERLSEARETVASKDDDSLEPEVAFFAIGISECMRHWDIDRWIVAQTTNPLITDSEKLPLPEDLDAMIGDWGSNSMDCYGPDPPECVRMVKRNLEKHEELKEERVYQKVKAIPKQAVVEVSIIKNDKCNEGEEDEEENNLEGKEEAIHDEDGIAGKNKEEEESEEDDEKGMEEDIALDEEGGSGDTICTITFSANKSLAACGVKNGNLNICETATRTLIGTLLGFKSEPEWVKWHPGGLFVIAGSQDGTVLLWSVEHFALLTAFNIQSPVVCADFSPDGKYVCTGDVDGCLTIWDPSNLEPKHAVQGGNYHKEGINCLAFTLDSQFVITGSHDTSLSIVDVDSGTVIGSLKGHKGSVLSVCISQSNRVATGGRDGTLMLWDIAGGEPLFICPHDDAVVCLLWLGNSRFVASGCTDGRVRIWDGLAGVLEFCSLDTYPGTMRYLMVAPDGDSLLLFTTVWTYQIDISMYKGE